MLTEGTEMSHSLRFGNMNEALPGRRVSGVGSSPDASLTAAYAPVFYYYYYHTLEWGLALHGAS